MPSIIGKLRRFGDMSLARMQDIGGIRVILKDMSEVRKFHSNLCKKGMSPETILPSKDSKKTVTEASIRSSAM
jgi:ppGpp synthetase/RelA/SpoT-type nucleotidyltranferase